MVEHVECVKARHYDITNHKIKDLLFKHFECAYTVIRLVYLITLLAQQVSDELPTAKFVVNHKDCLWHSFPCSSSETSEL